MDEETRHEFDRIRADHDRELAHLRELLTTVVTGNDRSNQQTNETFRESFALAREGNNRRFDQMSEFRNRITEDVNQMTSRREFELLRDTFNDKLDETRRQNEARFDTELKPINQRMEVMGRPNWALLLSAISVFLVMVGGIWLVIGLKIDATMAPLGLDLAQARATATLNTERLRQIELVTSNSTAADAQSRQDRTQLNDRLRLLEATVAANEQEHRGALSTLTAKLVEVETQFCASDIIRNLMHAQDMRTTSIMWAKAVPGTQMPTDNSYYPSICNRDGDGVPKMK